MRGGPRSKYAEVLPPRPSPASGRGALQRLSEDLKSNNGDDVGHICFVDHAAHYAAAPSPACGGGLGWGRPLDSSKTRAHRSLRHAELVAADDHPVNFVGAVGEAEV